MAQAPDRRATAVLRRSLTAVLRYAGMAALAFLLFGVILLVAGKDPLRAYGDILTSTLGSAYGLSEDLIREADLSVSLSPMTFPHELARLPRERAALRHPERVGVFAPDLRIARDPGIGSERALVGRRGLREAVGVEFQSREEHPAAAVAGAALEMPDEIGARRCSDGCGGAIGRAAAVVARNEPEAHGDDAGRTRGQGGHHGNAALPRGK